MEIPLKTQYVISTYLLLHEILITRYMPEENRIIFWSGPQSHK